MPNDLRKTRDLVLVENTAQAVFKHLDRIRDSRASFATRWAWELLQNAHDAATSNGSAVRLEVSGGQFRFLHDGRSFSDLEIAHLIYHGSTKVDKEEEIGRFGSGFLSTHLVSPVVRVQGRLSDNRHFSFALDRSGGSVQALRDGMERSFEEFEESITDAPSRDLGRFTTSFEYQVGDESLALLRSGLQQVQDCAPNVLAFAPSINSIEIEDEAGAWSIARRAQASLGEGLSLLEFGGTLSAQQKVALDARSAGLLVALSLSGTAEGLSVIGQKLPHLFIVFPLIGTERLSLPVAISCTAFKPLEDRNGIVLTGDAEASSSNGKLLYEAVPAIARLLKVAAEHGWTGIAELVGLETTELPDWANQKWTIGYFAQLLSEIRNIPIVQTEAGSWIPPKEMWLPYGDSAINPEIARLLSHWLGAREKMPRAAELNRWCENLESWTKVSQQSADQIVGVAFGLESLVHHMSEARDLTSLQKAVPTIPATEWLNDLLSLVCRQRRTELFDRYPALPDQQGQLKRRHELKLDQGIDSRLKDVAQALGVDLRAKLLSAEAALPAIVQLLPNMSEREAAAEVVAMLKSKCVAGRMQASALAAAVELLAWLMTKPQCHNLITGLPVATSEGEGDTFAAIELSSAGSDDDRPLPPVNAWDQRLLPFQGLFPKRRVVNSAYSSIDWALLSHNGFVLDGPLFRTERAIARFLPDEPLPTSDGAKGHEALATTPVSDIAFLNSRDAGLLDSARKSRSRALLLLDFVLTVLESIDDQAFEMRRVACSCGSAHNAFGAAWLIPLSTRAWVPLDTDGRRADKATAESLASLVEEAPELNRRLTTEFGAKFLRAMGISVADFALRGVAKDEGSRISLIRSMSALAHAAGGDLRRVADLVNEIDQHPEILLQIEHQRATRQQVKRNQEIGAVVESILRKALEQAGLVVRRTGIGSDFEVESDVVADGQELVLELVGQRRTTLIEIKSTSTDIAKMTPRQAEMACQEGDRFCLCVVPIMDGEITAATVAHGCRFIFGLKAEVQPAWLSYQTIRTATSVARTQTGSVLLEMIEGNYRFILSRQLWESGLPFQDAVSRLISGEPFREPA